MVLNLILKARGLYLRSSDALVGIGVLVRRYQADGVAHQRRHGRRGGGGPGRGGERGAGSSRWL